MQCATGEQWARAACNHTTRVLFTSGGFTDGAVCMATLAQVLQDASNATDLRRFPIPHSMFTRRKWRGNDIRDQVNRVKGCGNDCAVVLQP